MRHFIREDVNSTFATAANSGSHQRCLTRIGLCPKFRTWCGYRARPNRAGGPTIMTPDAMGQIGRALYGERWQTSLATDLDIADRTMRRWLTGESAIPGNVERDLRN